MLPCSGACAASLTIQRPNSQTNQSIVSKLVSRNWTRLASASFSSTQAFRSLTGTVSLPRPNLSTVSLLRPK